MRSQVVCIQTHLHHSTPVSLLLKEQLLYGRQAVQVVLHSLDVVFEDWCPPFQQLRRKGDNNNDFLCVLCVCMYQSINWRFGETEDLVRTGRRRDVYWGVVS